jgi:hypothetical protein
MASLFEAAEAGLAELVAAAWSTGEEGGFYIDGSRLSETVP